MYNAFYRKPGALFWRKIKNVTGDSSFFFNGRDGTQHVQPLRVLTLADNTRIELPMTVIVKFSAERFEEIRAQMSKESGQNIDAGVKRKK